MFTMTYQGSCHCGAISYEVEGAPEQVMECNCSHCQRKGYLLWFVDRKKLLLHTPADKLATYTFNKHVIKHRFCPECGIHPYAEGVDAKGNKMAAINVRCLEDFDLKKVAVKEFDGRAL
jgi:hypothetical protein